MLDAAQAGNSGLCGGSVPVNDEIILLTESLNKVMAFDEVCEHTLHQHMSQIMTCELLPTDSYYHLKHNAPCQIILDPICRAVGLSLARQDALLASYHSM